MLPGAGGSPHHPVDHHEKYLSDEEIVIGQSAHQHRHGEQPPAALLHLLLDAQQQQRKPDHRLMKVVEEHVIQGKPGESIQHPRQHRHAGLQKPPGISIGGQGSARHLQRQQGRHQIGHRRRRERQRQPEKGAAQQIEGIGADKIRPQICQPVPPELPAAHRIVRHLVKGDLLGVKIPIIGEIAPIINNKRQEQQHRHPQRP